MSIIRTVLCPITLFLLLAPAIAEDQTKDRTDQAKAKLQKRVAEPAPETVELRDGADSAEGALRAFVAASKASDDEAALKMVDPPIQKLLIPEIVIERSAIDSMIIDQAFFGEDKQRSSGILFYFAWRDLINLRSAEILETRVVDEDRVVFTVYSTEGSYHDDGDTTTVQDILAVRRSEKWYVVKLFGMLTHYFRGNDAESDKTKRPLLQSKNGAAGAPNRRNADYQLQFNLPIEFIHAELVECSKSQQMAECLALANQLQRHFKSVENQAKRGRIKSRAELRQAFDHANPRIEDLMLKIPLILEPSLKKLEKQLLDNQAESKAR